MPSATIRAAVPHPCVLAHPTAAPFTALGGFGHRLQALAPALVATVARVSRGHLPGLSLVAGLLGK